ASFLLCVSLALKLTNGLAGTEFSGAWLTGPLLSMAYHSMILFVLALVLTFFSRESLPGWGLSPRCFAYRFMVSSLRQFRSLRCSRADTNSVFNRSRDFTGMLGQ